MTRALLRSMPTGPEKSGGAIEEGTNFVFARKAEIGQPRQFADLDFVQAMVAANQQDDQLFCGDDGEQLDRALQWYAKQGGHGFAGGLAGRRYVEHGFAGGWSRRCGHNGFRQFHIGGVIRVRAKRERIFARIRQHMKFMRAAAADGAGVCGDRAELQTEAGKNAGVRFVHHAVGLFQAFKAAVEGIGILHDELARAHHAETRTDFVAELGLDLVEVQRQLAVALHFAPRDVGDDLLMRGAEAEQVVVPVLDLQHLRAEHIPASGFLPQFGGLHGGHQQLDTAAPVHLFAHDRFDFAQYAQAQGHPGVQAAGEFADVARAQHQAVAGQFGFGRGFLESGNKKL